MQNQLFYYLVRLKGEVTLVVAQQWTHVDKIAVVYSAQQQFQFLNSFPSTHSSFDYSTVRALFYCVVISFEYIS